MTTTRPYYFVLDKLSSSYTFHLYRVIKEVKAIPEAVEELLNSRLQLDSRTRLLEIRYYLPDEPLQPGGSNLKKKIEQTVNDQYLEYNCREIDLDELGEDTPRSLIAVGVSVAIVEVNFHVFVHAGEDERVTYIGAGTVRGGPGRIMDLVKEEAKAMAGESQDVDPDISWVYKATKLILEDVLRGFKSRGEIRKMSIVEPFEGLPQDGSSLILVLGIDMRKVDFHVYIRAGEDEPTIYAGREFVEEEPRKVMGLIKEKAEKMARTYEDVSPDLSITRFYKLSESVPQQNFGTKGQISTMPEGDPLEGIPHDKSSLIIEIVTHTYKYAVFRKQDSGYTFSGLRSVHALPGQSLEVLVMSVEDHFKGLSIPASVSTSVLVLEPKGDFRDKSPQGWKGVQLTAENFGKDLIECSRTLLFRVLPRTLVVIFEVSSSALDTILEEPHVDRETVAKLARKRESPSSGSKISALLLNQHGRRGDAVYNSRPYTLTGAPVQLYHPAFARFIRGISSPVDTGELPHEELDRAADFIYNSLNFFEGEADRQERLKAVKGVLGNLSSGQIKVDARIIKPDGTTTVHCGSAEKDVYVRIVELKNDIGVGDSDPIAQAECGFVLICSSEMYKPLREASCCPMFLVGVVGPHLAVSGAVFADRFVSQRFTDYIYLGPLPGGGAESPLSHRIRRVAQIFHVLKECTDDLGDYYKSLEFQLTPTSESKHMQSHGSSYTIPTPLHPISQQVPPPHFQTYTTGSEKYKITYTKRLARDFPSKAVFKGTIEREGDESKTMRDVVIKFTNVYCKEAHELLAKIFRAPKLWFCDRVEGVGMYVVVMDYVGGGQAEDFLTDAVHIEQLQTAVDALHKEGYVHGDLRGPNLLIAEDGLKLVDFDWCGKQGEARYPADINIGARIKWHDGVHREGLITKEHDTYMLGLLVGTSKLEA